MKRNMLFWISVGSGMFFTIVFFFLPVDTPFYIVNIVLGILVVCAGSSFFFYYLSLGTSSYTFVRDAYKKQYGKKLYLSIRDKRTFTSIWDTAGYMQYHKELYPFDAEFGTLFAAQDSEGLLAYMLGKHYSVEDQKTMLEVLDVVYRLKQESIENWTNKKA